ncbi:MAG: Na+/H+ antiporter NhaA, partial [Candidatus Competibacteraceae bacterium]|nr:Na+/H+ antiporter NhaA [Candidatus Competibacteraceae bacterium]
LAIVDDLGAVMVIALFYTESLDLAALGIGVLLVAVLVAMNRGGIRRTWPYAAVGLALWLAMLISGVHATLAGVLTALTIPARSRYEPGIFSIRVRDLMDRFDARRRADGSTNPLRNAELRGILQTLENGVRQVETPLQRMEHSMHVPVAFLIIPLFALANAGVPIDFTALGEVLTQPITLGVILGLLVGKVVGIAGLSLFAVRQGWGQLPAGTTPMHIIGASLLGGIGFTMSIFIAELGFRGQEEQLVLAKTGVLCASLIAGISGFVWLWLAGRSRTA